MKKIVFFMVTVVCVPVGIFLLLSKSNPWVVGIGVALILAGYASIGLLGVIEGKEQHDNTKRR